MHSTIPTVPEVNNQPEANKENAASVGGDIPTANRAVGDNATNGGGPAPATGTAEATTISVKDQSVLPVTDLEVVTAAEPNAPNTGDQLSQEEKKALAVLEEDIDKMKRGIIVAFFQMIAAFYRIKEEKLYRGTHKSFEAYFAEKWNFKRSHS